MGMCRNCLSDPILTRFSPLLDVRLGCALVVLHSVDEPSSQRSGLLQVFVVQQAPARVKAIQLIRAQPAVLVPLFINCLGKEDLELPESALRTLMQGEPTPKVCTMRAASRFTTKYIKDPGRCLGWVERQLR